MTQPSGANPVRRGRRDVELANRMSRDDEDVTAETLYEPELDDRVDESDELDDPGLDFGDTIEVKVNEVVRNPVTNDERRFGLTYIGTVREGETGQRAFRRIASELNRDFDDEVDYRNGVAYDKENARKAALREGLNARK
jgi:hypothetical protein